MERGYRRGPAAGKELRIDVVSAQDERLVSAGNRASGTGQAAARKDSRLCAVGFRPNPVEEIVPGDA
jgi:hypothetical protein